MTLTFLGYEIQDGGINLHFVSLDPGQGEANDKYVLLTDTDLLGI